MSTPETRQQVEQLVAEKKYDEAKALLQSAYNLTEEQALAFIQKLEQPTDSKAPAQPPGCAQKAKKGCGCMSVLFLFLAAWGIYGLYKQYHDNVLIKGMVVGYHTTESTNNDGKLQTHYAPIVIYSFAGSDYRDTLDNTRLSPAFAVNSTIDLYIDPQQPEWATEDSLWGAATMYIPFLVLALLSFLGYRYIGKVRIKFNPLGQNLKKLQEVETAYKQGGNEEEAREKAIAMARAKFGDGFTEVDTKTQKIKTVTPAMAFRVGAVIILVGIGFMYLSYRQHQRGERLAAGDTVVGTVLSERRETSQNKTTGYHYVIAYEYKGTAGEYETSTLFDNYNQGDQVELKIDPADPEEMAINMKEDLYGRGFSSLILFLLALGGGAIYVGFYLRKQKKAAAGNDG